MTLDEAIKHAEELAKLNMIRDCQRCAAEHRQLAAWLRELKAYREKYPARSLEQYDGEGAE